MDAVVNELKSIRAESEITVGQFLNKKKFISVMSELKHHTDCGRVKPSSIRYHTQYTWFYNWVLQYLGF